MAAVENVIGSPVADTLIGDAAANELSAGDGDDTVQGAGGDDVLEGQGGTDSTSYAAAGGPVAADLRAGTVTGEGSDAISGIENLTGSPHADTIIGDDAANVLDGGPGSDTASFAGAPAGVEADLGFQSASGDGQDTLLGFEHLSGSAHADKLIGDGAANALAGGEGNDTLTGLGGNDALQGGGGSDNAAYGSAPGPINADLRASSVTGEGNDALGSVEGIIGSPHGDTLAGDANSNRLDGAGGTDTVSFAASPALVDAGLGTGVVTGDGADTLLSVENAIGSSHDDSIAGTAGDNAIAGGPGNDTIARRGRRRSDLGRERQRPPVRRRGGRLDLRRRRRRPARRRRRRERVRRRHRCQHVRRKLRRHRAGADGVRDLADLDRHRGSVADRRLHAHAHRRRGRGRPGGTRG